MRISDWSSDVCSSDLDSVRFSAYRALALPKPTVLSPVDAHTATGSFSSFNASVFSLDVDQHLHTLRVFGLHRCSFAAWPMGQAALFAMPIVYSLAIDKDLRSEEHTSELQSLMRISYAVFCLKKKIIQTKH